MGLSKTETEYLFQNRIFDFVLWASSNTGSLTMILVNLVNLAILANIVISVNLVILVKLEILVKLLILVNIF